MSGVKREEILKNAFIKRAKKFLEENGVNPDSIDIESEWDSSLTPAENDNLFKNKMLEGGVIRPDWATSEKDQEDFYEYVTDYVERNRPMPNRIKEFYYDLHRALDKLRLGYANMLFVKGRAGIGKSYQIKWYLKKHDLDYVIAKKVTPAYLYRFLYENNGKIIWFKDIMRLFNDGEMKEMIKGIGETDPEDRIITNFTYSKETKDLPKSFITTSKFIFDYNTENLSQLRFKEDFLAILSRGEYIELVFDFEEMANLMRKIAKNKWQREVTEFLIKNYKFVGLNQFNLRTQQKAFNTYLWAKKTKRNWKEELKRELEMNLTPAKAFLYQFMGRKPISRVELKRMLIQSGYVNTVRTAERRIENWLECGELHIIPDGRQRNHLVSIFDLSAMSLIPKTDK